MFNHGIFLGSCLTLQTNNSTQQSRLASLRKCSICGCCETSWKKATSSRALSTCHSKIGAALAAALVPKNYKKLENSQRSSMCSIALTCDTFLPSAAISSCTITTRKQEFPLSGPTAVQFQSPTDELVSLKGFHSWAFIGRLLDLIWAH